jgi:ribosomal protein S18 acetylase RimI-like enzyme
MLKQLPSYESIFGKINFKKGDEARSVYSPAAYLADLLQLLDDEFQDSSLTFNQRRSDIKELLLDAKNTFEMLPYLDRVNEVVSSKIKNDSASKEDAFEQIRNAVYPFNVPQDIDYEAIKVHLRHLGVQAEELYKLFDEMPEPELAAKVYLNLFEEEWLNLIETARTGNELAGCYGVAQLTDLTDANHEVLIDNFLNATEITGLELRELLYQNLHTEVEKNTTQCMTQFFCNSPTQGYALLTDDELRVKWHGIDGTTVENGIHYWLDRANRFIRLAKKIGFTFTELDLVLRSCCNNRLDSEAFVVIAVVHWFRKNLELDVDAICGFFSGVNQLGHGNDDELPIDLFNRTYNNSCAIADKRYIGSFEVEPYQFTNAGLTRLTFTGDILDSSNDDYRKRVAHALDVPVKQLTYLIKKFRSHFDNKQLWYAGTDTEELEMLATFYRVSKLAALCEVSLEDLFILFDVLEKDPTVRQYMNSNVLIDLTITEPDCYAIISTNTVKNGLWLTQVVYGLCQWMQKNDFRPHDLLKITSGGYVETIELKKIDDTMPIKKVKTQKEIDDQETLALLDRWHQAFKPFHFKADSLIKAGLDARTSQLVYETLIDDEYQLTLKDPRILSFDSQHAQKAVFDALNHIDIITERDFQGLGIGTKYADKIYERLIAKGYLTTEGRLIKENLPEDNEDFEINNDFDALRFEIFDKIKELHANHDDITIYPSDLTSIGLAEIELDDLYNNLIFNGYLEEDGTLKEQAFFEDDKNVDNFEVNANIQGHAKDEIFRILFERNQEIELYNIPVNQGVFSDLPLSEQELDDLIENLRFNEYIDDKNNVVANLELAQLKLKDFFLELQFYPHRTAILSTLQSHLEKHLSAYLLFTRDNFMSVADAVAANWCYVAMTANYLENNRLKEKHKRYFREEENAKDFDVWWAFEPSENETVFHAIRNIVLLSDQLQLKESLLDDLAFSGEQKQEMFALLIDMGMISEEGKITEDELAYFLNIDNALTFTLNGFEDYNKDIFFFLHAVAKEQTTLMNKIVGHVKQLAMDQEKLIFKQLKEKFNLNVDSMRVISKEMFKGSDHVSAEWILPLLEAEDLLGNVTSFPNDRQFNNAYFRTQQFALLANKLKLTKEDIELVFLDQSLIEKFPEKLTLPTKPAPITTIDALLEHTDGSTLLFQGDRYWVYDRATYDFKEIEGETHEEGQALEELGVPGLTTVDAAFVDNNGNNVIISRDKYYRYSDESERWEWIETKREWGEADNNFQKIDEIDAAYTDASGYTYLFSRDQYARRSLNSTFIDEGYPKSISQDWKNEPGNSQLTETFQEGLDAAFVGLDGETYFFKEKQFVGLKDLATPQDILSKWGQSQNNLKTTGHINAGYIDEGRMMLFSGDQILGFDDCLENDDVQPAKGFPKLLKDYFTDLPAEFQQNIDASFRDQNQNLYLFKDDQYITVNANNQKIAGPADIKSVWGKTLPSLTDGAVDAGFVGLDGKTYLFSGNQYIRYSGGDYSQMDSGYPRTIASDWGQLTQIDAAFVLDGKTYLFGRISNEPAYVRYSSNDYRKADDDYPREVDNNWWNLPQTLIESGFTEVDAVFTDAAGRIYLFSGNQFVESDAMHRWWSEPQLIAEKWDTIPFTQVDAAFTGKDGKTYLFSDKKYARFSDADFCRLDSGYPRSIDAFWGTGNNAIAEGEKIRAAVTLDSEWEETDINDQVIRKTARHTYLLCGEQFFRYTGDQYQNVEAGYPRLISDDLADEPRFKQLKEDKARVDIIAKLAALTADKRNIYLFADQRVRVLSEKNEKTYEDFTLPAEAISCAFDDNGAVYIEDATVGWQHITSLEGENVVRQEAKPDWMAKLSNGFENQPNAVLKGTDSNTYLFKGKEVYNLLLDESAPIDQEWGRVFNRVYESGSIDAALVGRDGSTYLFSNDQCFTYKNNQPLDQLASELPESIEEKWGGLKRIAHAYVLRDKTYLMEPADDNGAFRYVRYSSNGYEKPDEGYPKQATFDFWDIPVEYQQEGFDGVDAVFVEQDKLTLIRDGKFLEYNSKRDYWSYPKHLDRLWKGIACDSHVVEELKTVFIDHSGAIYCFNDEQFVSITQDPNAPDTYNLSDPRRTRYHWGLTKTVLQDGVDAAVVDAEGSTYLFSGDQYVRYSTNDYRYVDPEYPKAILTNLRNEAAFKNLPDAFEQQIAQDQATKASTPAQTGLFIQAAVANQRNIYLVMNTTLFVASSQSVAEYQSSALVGGENVFCSEGTIDAAVTFVDTSNPNTPKKYTYLFSGQHYIRYSDETCKYIDNGYPKSIVSGLAGEPLAPNGILPAALNQFYDGIDAALRDNTGTLHLIKGGIDWNSQSNTIGEVQDIWGELRSNFTGDQAIDAAFIDRDGGLVVFKGDQYIRYTDPLQEHIDAGYPKAIQHNWGNLPASFESGINGAFRFEEHVYFVKGDEYVRFIHAGDECPHVMGPYRFDVRWGAWADYLISDIQTITRFKKLRDVYVNGDSNLTELLHPKHGNTQLPYFELAEMFDWDINQIKWLKKNNLLLQPSNQFENRFGIESMLKLFRFFEITHKMSTEPKELYEKILDVFFPDKDDVKKGDTYPDNAQFKMILEELSKLLTHTNCGAEGVELLHNEIRDELNLLKRDALVPFAIYQDAEVKNSRDLYEKLLIDVKMGSCASTSKIKEALAAVQLFMNRYFVNLEDAELKDADQEQRRKELLERWRWMKNYRVWEANRKVFLYPENYIRAELRDTKTPEFLKLEQSLAQGEPDEASLTQAFNQYIDQYTALSQLKVAGGYMYDSPENPADKNLVLFSHTKSDPRQFYYRSATFFDGSSDSVDWKPWEEVSIQINSARVYPVFMLNRVYVFWAEIEQKSSVGADTGVSINSNDDDMSVESNAVVESVMQIYYSYYDLNKTWAPAQKLNTQITSNDSIADYFLSFSGADKTTEMDLDRVRINCSYTTERQIKPKLNADGIVNRNVLINTLRKASEDGRTRIYLKAVNSQGLHLMGYDQRTENGVNDLYAYVNRILPGDPFDKVENKFEIVESILPDEEFISIKSIDPARENHYLVDDSNRLKLRPFGAGQDFLFDSSFRIVKGLVGDGYSLETVNMFSYLAAVLDTDAFKGLVDKNLLYFDELGEVKTHDRANFKSQQDKRRATFEIIADRSEELGSFYFYPETRVVESINADTGESSGNTSGIKVFQDLFPNEDVKTLELPVSLHTPESKDSLSWVCFDYKGGSFLCKPASLAPSVGTGNIVNSSGSAFTTDASFVANSNLYVFSKEGEYAQTTVPQSLSDLNISSASATQNVWGKVNNKIQLDNQVDAACVIDGKTYLFRDDQYVRYSRGYDGPVDDGYPQLLTDVGFSTVDAAFQFGAHTYYMKGDQYTRSDDVTVKRPLSDLWLATQPEPPSQDLIAHFPFAGNADDIGSGNYNGTVHGAALTTDHIGAVDHAYQFDGSNDYIELPAMNVNYTKGFTVQAWVYFASFNEQSRIIDFGNGENNDNIVFCNKATSNDLRFKARRGSTVIGTLDALGVLERNTWMHLAVTVDNDGNAIIYKDGVSVQQGMLGKFHNTNRRKNYIGRSNWSVDDYFDGKIADLSIHNRALTAAEIAELADSQGASSIDYGLTKDNKLFLVSGQNYMRYSNADDLTQPDAGYPKPLAQAAADSLPTETGITAAFTAVDNKSYFFKDDKYFVSDQPGTKKDINSKWGIVKNNIADSGKVDAAFTLAGKTYLFSGDQYYRYGDTQYNFVEMGYPRLLADNQEGLPRWSGSLRAVFSLENKIFLFTNSQYAMFDPQSATSEVKNIRGNWEWPDGFSQFDAAFQFQTNQHVYLLKNDEYVEVDKFLSSDNTKYDIVRLSSMTGDKISQALFARGIDNLFNLKNQEIDELPIFTSDTSLQGDSVIQINDQRIQTLPLHSHLEFRGANGLYYWELFFHAPLLIAQTLNSQQKFEEAKKWFETIFNPTNEYEYWEFLPFLAVDIDALVLRLRTYSEELNLTATPVVDLLTPYTEAFEGKKELTSAERQALAQLPLNTAFTAFKSEVDAKQAAGATEAGQRLSETLDIIARLPVRYDFMVPDASASNPQIKAYLEDPFDPHAIARLRRIAYRRATVMGYVDNLIDWGDQLFRQYTRESINEARMHYILAYDLLGQKPANTGDLLLSDALPYNGTDGQGQMIGIADKGAEFDSTQYDFLFDVSGDVIEKTSLTFAAKTHTTVANPYFFVPENQNLIDYWDRIEDRLHKIRHCLNIMGIAQPLPLFQPPIDPMALVRAVAGGGGMGGAIAGLSVPIPHYRFTFMLSKARELTGKLSQLGGEFLGAIEKKDGEALSLLHNRHEKEILEITIQIREAQLNEALENLKSLKENLKSSEQQREHYQKLIDDGLITPEIVQIAMMGTSIGLHIASAIVKAIRGAVSLTPEVAIGPPFASSVTMGGGNFGDAMDALSEVISTGAEAVSMGGEIAGIFAQHQRSVQDWQLQLKMAKSEIASLEHQIEGSKYQIQAARLEVSSTEREIKHNDAENRFMKQKFSNEQLYQWMSGKLSALFFQTYNLAHDMAKAAEKSYQFECGVKAAEASFIGGMYWDSLRKGLLSGDSLDHDLDRLEKAYLDGNIRSLEIGKNISLSELDPMAFVQLKSKGACEFHLTEALFDYDFQGHYQRQVKTIAVAIDAGEGKTVNATLTQLRNKMVLKPDVKAVKYLLNPQGKEPSSLRTDWRTSQQIALGDIGEYDEPNGMFEARLDDDRFLPFEGTGAVSSWRLELNGKRGSYQLNEIKSVTITLKYTARNGGTAFASAVKGLLKPYPTAVYFNMAEMFTDAWYDFVDGKTETFDLPVTHDMLPNLSGSKITGLVPYYDIQGDSPVTLIINDDTDLTLKQGQFNQANGLIIPGSGATWTLTAKGDTRNLNNLGLVVMYNAKP